MSATICPVTETYNDVEKLMWYMCHQFAAKHGGCVDDMFSTAQEVFMDAYKGWKVGMAPFSTFLATCIYRRLLDEKIKNQRYVNTIKEETMEQYADPREQYQSFDLQEFTANLSADASLLVDLIINTPEQIAAVASAKGGHPYNLRTSVKEYLRSIGWTFSRITESFEEVSSLF